MLGSFVSLIIPALVCGLSAFLMGLVWYHPKVLGTRWLEARGKNDRAKMDTPFPFVLTFLLWLVAGFFYIWIAQTFGIETMGGLFSLSCLLWVAFAMPPTVIGSIYTGYPLEAGAIDSSYQLAGYYMFALIYSLILMF